MMHQICCSFYWNLRKLSKLDQKADFLAHFDRFFLFMRSYTLWVTTQRFGKWKNLLRYISVVSFINIAFVIVMLKIFKLFHIDSAAMKWSLFRGFWILLPQILFDLAEILTRVSLPKRQTQCLKNSSKFWILPPTQWTQSLQFGTRFTGGKPKILLKTKIFGKTASLGVSNNISLSSQKKLQNSCKIKFLDPNL